MSNAPHARSGHVPLSANPHLFGRLTGSAYLLLVLAAAAGLPVDRAHAQSYVTSMPSQAPPLPVGVGQPEPEKRTWWGGTSSRTAVPAGMPTRAPAITQKDLQRLRAEQPLQVTIADPLLESVVVMESRLPADREAQLGERMAQVVLTRSALYPDLALQGYVNDLGRWLSLHGPRHERNWVFGVLAEAQPRALALPGGYVFVSQGLLERLTNEAALAGVLARQIALSSQGGMIRALSRRVIASPQTDLAAQTWLVLDEPVDAQAQADADGLAYVMLSGGGFAAGPALQAAIRSTAQDSATSGKGLFDWLRGGTTSAANAAQVNGVSAPTVADRLSQVRSWDARNLLTDRPDVRPSITIAQRLQQLADADKPDTAARPGGVAAAGSQQPSAASGEPGFFARWWSRIKGN